MTYQEFIESKRITSQKAGLTEIPPLHDSLFDYQKKSVEFSLSAGRSALFLDTGLGKTLCQLEWAKHVPGKKLILAPLAVSEPTRREGQRIGLDVYHSKDGNARGEITITNYERAHLFNLSEFTGIVLDESSILKAFMGKTKQWLCESFKQTPYRLCCTATPAPNDNEELGNHSEFLGQISRPEMLARWFIHDSANTADWRLKGHAVESFWKWVATWAVCAGKPSDLGGDDSRHILPPLNIATRIVDVDHTEAHEDMLFRLPALSATEIRGEKKHSLESRVECSVTMAKSHNKPFIVWCETNDESSALAKALGDDCVEVKGSDDVDTKEDRLDSFSLGKVRGIVTKPSIAGFGLNWQHCSHAIFSSVSYSYEQFYQAVRRSWRFGQKNPVRVDVVMAETEMPIWKTIQRKMAQHEDLKRQMQIAASGAFVQTQAETKKAYNPTHVGHLPQWILK